MSSSIGPVQRGKPRHGQCAACWDENFFRKHGYYFEWRVPMVNKPCGHRLLPPRRTIKASQASRINARRRDEVAGYWERRSLLPDYCGEPRELSSLALAGLRWMDDAGAEAAVELARNEEKRCQDG